MKGMLYTADHHVYELPPLLEWNVRHTGTVPCDSWSVTAVYRPEMAPVLKMAAGFAAVEDGAAPLRGIVDENSVEPGPNGLAAGPFTHLTLSKDRGGVIPGGARAVKKKTLVWA